MSAAIDIELTRQALASSTLSHGLGKVADRVIETCPTGALVHQEEKPDS